MKDVPIQIKLNLAMYKLGMIYGSHLYVYFFTLFKLGTFCFVFHASTCVITRVRHNMLHYDCICGGLRNGPHFSAGQNVLANPIAGPCLTWNMVHQTDSYACK